MHLSMFVCLIDCLFVSLFICLFRGSELGLVGELNFFSWPARIVLGGPSEGRALDCRVHRSTVRAAPRASVRPRRQIPALSYPAPWPRPLENPPTPLCTPVFKDIIIMSSYSTLSLQKGQSRCALQQLLSRRTWSNQSQLQSLRI